MRASCSKATEIEECVGATRRLPTAWRDPSRWHTVIEGNFKFREAIHMKEGRATIMGLRRAVAGTAGHGHRFLSLTDNMSSLLAFERGRSRSYDPLCLCRRAAALCIGAVVSCVLRHLETWRNPSDDGSRRVSGFGRARSPLHGSGALGVQVRVNPEPANPVKPAPSRFRHARAVLELCHGDPRLSASTWRRGAHVAPSCDLNTALLEPEWISAVLFLICSGCIWYLHVGPGAYKWSSESNRVYLFTTRGPFYYESVHVTDSCSA